MSLNNIPNEITHKIIHFLDQRSKAAFSLTSHHFNKNVEPFLCESITQTGCAAIPNLLRTMLAKPYLAKLVKHFSATTIDESFGEFLDVSFLTQENLKRMQFLVEEAGLFLADVWISVIQDNIKGDFAYSQYDATLAFCLVLFAETLETFEAVYFRTSHYWTRHLLKISPEYLKNLRDVSIVYSEESDYAMHVGDSADRMPLSVIIPWLKLPSLERFTTEKVEAEGCTEIDLDLKSNVVDLTVDGKFDTESVKAFLRCFPSTLR